jgi:hypothetical protein
MKPRASFLLLTTGTGLLTFLTAGLIWAQSYSHARIVRLSFAEGTVTVQRPDAAEWAQAPVNTPLQEGFKLSTAENSFAEVEFENASTVRLGQLTLLEFTQLALAPSGGKINRLTLQHGYATFHTLPESGDVYAVNTPSGTLTPQGKAMFRVDLDEGAERVEVFKGSVDMSSFLGSWTLAKNQVLELRPGTDQPANLSEGITEDAWDEWGHQREGRAELSQRGPSPNLYSNSVTDLLYGWNDLSTYGMWSYMPGYGYGWIPTVPFGWAPYTQGRWCWYPSFGYTWISFEPWGWLPYHYGYWNYFPGMGWGWFPSSFGMWSPAMVNWYMGSGWIGWVPQGIVKGGNACAQAQRCGAVVGVNTFQNGTIVNPANILPMDPLQGHRINGPNIPPGRPVILPGPVVSPTGAFAGAHAIPQNRLEDRGRQIYNHAPSAPAAEKAPAVTAAPLSRPAVGAGVRGVVTAPNSTIVFDPTEGRYVNSQNARPVGSVWPSVGGPGGTPKAGGAGQPSMQGMMPAVPASLPDTKPDERFGAAVGTTVVAPSGAGAGTRQVAPSTTRAPSAPADRSSPGASSPSTRPAPPPRAQSGGGWFHHSNPGSSAASTGGARGPSMQSGGRMSSSGAGAGAPTMGGGGAMGGGAHAGGTTAGGGGHH